MAHVEIMFDEAGNIIIARDGIDILELPVVTLHKGVTVCEFRRLDSSIGLRQILSIVRRDILADLCEGDYDSDWLQLIDLDEERWTQNPFELDTDQVTWKTLGPSWPPNIKTRNTAVENAPSGEQLIVRSSIDGHRFKWTAACAAPMGARVATASGETGTVRTTDLQTGTVTTLPKAGGPLMQLVWTLDDAFIGLENQVPHIHLFQDDQWRREELGTGHLSAVALSPDGTELAAAARDGQLWVFRWPSLDVRLRFTPAPQVTPKPRWTRAEPRSLWDVAWTSDTRHLVIGHTWPVVGFYDAATGAYVRHVEGTQHFQRDFAIGAEEQLAASLRMDVIDIHDRAGARVAALPNSSSFGISSAAFARNGALLVTECNDGVARVWDVASEREIGQYRCAKGEPVLRVYDTLVVRNDRERTLDVCQLP